MAAPTWLDAWRTADESASAAVDGVAADHPAGAPLEVARAVNAAVPPEGLLVVGSSNPIRDLDLVARPYTVGERRRVIANRGLSGIDGTLSTAIGAALARASSRAIAHVGDLTFLHDANALLIGPGEPRPDLTIVVASDDGGSIFATLEQGDPAFADVFERVYATPTGAHIGRLCEAFGVPHRLLEAKELPAALEEDVTGIRVLEVPVPRDTRRELASAVSDAVARPSASGELGQRPMPPPSAARRRPPTDAGPCRARPARWTPGSRRWPVISPGCCTQTSTRSSWITGPQVSAPIGTVRNCLSSSALRALDRERRTGRRAIPGRCRPWRSTGCRAGRRRRCPGRRSGDTSVLSVAGEVGGRVVPGRRTAAACSR